MKKILLVEDDDLLNKTLTYNLISEGYDTVSALNAGTAAGLLTQTEYDLVLLDINLPDGSGYDLCRLVKPENPDTLVIFLTANDQESDQIRKPQNRFLPGSGFWNGCGMRRKTMWTNTP